MFMWREVRGREWRWSQEEVMGGEAFVWVGGFSSASASLSTKLKLNW